jgi:hypothetical protein
MIAPMSILAQYNSNWTNGRPTCRNSKEEALVYEIALAATRYLQDHLKDEEALRQFEDRVNDLISSVSQHITWRAPLTSWWCPP